MPLTDPAAHGGDPADAFDVVVPSLPGYAFSKRDDRYGNALGFGTLFHKRMSDVLGYERYGAHGGDTGSLVCEKLVHSNGAAIVGVHLTDVPLVYAMILPT